MANPSTDTMYRRAYSSGTWTIRQTVSDYATKRAENYLIFATVALLPLQEHIPSVGGFSIMYLLFAAQAGYVILKRPDCLARVWLHPLLLAVYCFLCIGHLMEFSHPYSYYGELFQMIQNFGGSIFLGALCRDRKGLQFAMYGYLAAGVLFASSLLLNSYGTLSGAVAVDYGEADRLRNAVFDDNPLEYNLNGMAFITAQGAGVAFALGLTTQSARLRYFFLAVGLPCFLATFLPMSRSGIGILLGVCVTVVLCYGVTRIRTLLMAIFVGAVMVILVPAAIWSRMAFSTEVDERGRMEGRAAVYTAFFHHLPEVFMTGVGAGNFRGPWGAQSQYGYKGRAVNSHNVFFQMIIYWGAPALIGLMAILWRAYRCLPRHSRGDGLLIALRSIAVSLLLWMMTVHNLYAKEFAIGIGLLVAADCWIWRRSKNVAGRRTIRHLPTVKQSI